MKMKQNPNGSPQKLYKKQPRESSPQSKKSGRSVIRLRSRSLSNEEDPATKRRKGSTSKSVELNTKVGNKSKAIKLKDRTKVNQNNGRTQKLSGKEAQKAVKEKASKKPLEESSKMPNVGNSKFKVISQKKNFPKVQEPNEFIDLWSLATIGKREASLNATMKVNIMYERQTSPKKGSGSCSSHSPKRSSKTLSKSPTRKQSLSSVVKTENESFDSSPQKVDKKISHKKTNTKDICSLKSRKRKISPYTIFEDEPAPKSKKIEPKPTKTKPKKQTKKIPRSLGLGHYQSNIIEKSPRQASLNAKAIIAMGTEDDIVSECGARTRIYDWMEVRPYFQNHVRKMVWVTGHGDPKYTNVRMRKTSSEVPEMQSIENEKAQVVTDDSKGYDGVNVNLIDSSIQDTLLKTIHEIADPRLLREYLRSQKEDFEGYVDVETCPSPKPVEKVIHLPPPSPKKKLPPSSTETVDKSDRQTGNEKERPKVPSPAKPKPFRVDTPIPQFPPDQKATHMTSFVHHPIPQSFYQPVQQNHPQPQSHPIKVTPYTPNPAYIYQYSTDRQQQNLFVQGNPSAMHYGVENSDLSQRNYQPTSFSFNHMGSLSLGRRGLNPYHQSSTFSPSIHLPVQTFGLNFHAAQYYQPQLQHLQAQPNLSALQPVPLQQYPLVQQTVVPTHPLVQNLTNQIQSYQPSFSPYSNISSQPMGQDVTGMRPPPPPSTSNSSPLKNYPIPSTLSSAKSGVPLSSISQTKSVKSFTGTNPTSTKSLPLKSTNASFMSKHFVNAQAQKASNEVIHMSTNCDTPGKAKPLFSVPIIKPLPLNRDKSVQVLPVCKREHEPGTLIGQKLSQKSEDAPSKSPSNVKVVGENSSVSDILHNAHSAMFPSDAPSFSENSLQPQSGSLTVSTSSKTCQTPKLLKGEGNVRFSVSSILDMPTIKVKAEPYGPASSKGAIKIVKEDQKSIQGPTQSGAFYICIPPPNIVKSIAKNPNLFPAKSAENNPSSHNPNKMPGKETTVTEMLHESDSIIIIDDSDSSDDEPLSKLIQSKSVRPKGTETIPCSKPDDKSTKSNTIKAQLKCKSTSTKEIELQKCNSKHGKPKVTGFSQVAQVQIKHQVEKPTNLPKVEKKGLKNLTTAVKRGRKDPSSEDSQCSKMDVFKSMKNTTKKSKVMKGPNLLKKNSSKKSKEDIVCLPTSSTIHGWSWIGKGEWKCIPKLSQQKEEPLRKRMCYSSMRHTSGEVISVKDCVILQSDGDGSVPYVAKVSALWENINGDMMFSMLWYYQPEHTSTGRESEDGEQELFASKHREENSVACIDDKCYVLMYNEYCRMESEAVRITQGLPLPRWRELIPLLTEENKKFCRPLPPSSACLDNIWFCRYDYDIRKKIVRKPKHKKTDLRYRAPCKLVS